MRSWVKAGMLADFEKVIHAGKGALVRQYVASSGACQDATQPVVLAPASAAHAHSEVGKAKLGTPSALVRFGIVRSYANSLVSADSDGGPSSPSSPGGPSALLRREGDIVSFRSLYVDIGEIDVQTDGQCFQCIEPLPVL